MGVLPDDGGGGGYPVGRVLLFLYPPLCLPLEALLRNEGLRRVSALRLQRTRV